MHPFRTVILTLLLLFPLFCVAQAGSDDRPLFLKYPTIPQFTITLPNGKSFTKANLKHKPTLIMLFSVDCEFCKHETSELISHIGAFKNDQIIMVTPFRVDEMAAYYKNYNISNFPEITMGSDPQRWLTSSFYSLRYFPGLYIYNRDQKLVYHFEGSQQMDTLIHYLNPR
ncbi:MAG TPA: TlpA disulfide reductase family protein [Chitinophagaceae bacterium]|nr:TlpA disulfide reductase family protein [Chitinophagaceae bacterium]